MRGTVYLVGAGPGNPDLLTRRAAKLLHRADVVIHDALVGQAILDLVREGAERVDVGKRCGGRRTAQEQINQLMVAAARDHRVVVRLKGGDPFIFGRGGEEALALRQAGVRFEVVPGVTAAVGVSAYSGIPLTHRDVASSVTFVTGHDETGGGPIDWDAVARLEGTVAIYMGLANLDAIAQKLIAGGRSSETPAAVVEWGTYAKQRTVTGSLAEIGTLVRSGEISAPAVVLIGEVASLRDSVAWFDRLPFRGLRVVIAKSRAEPSRLTRAFAARGADVTTYPRFQAHAIDSSPAMDQAFSTLTSYAWIILTASAAVSHFFQELKNRGLDARALHGVRVATCGRATSATLRRYGITPDVRARTYDATRLVESLQRFGTVAGGRILFPREGRAPSPITIELRESGARVEELEVFELWSDSEQTGTEETALLTADVIVLPSSSAARIIAAALEGHSPRGSIVAIGPQTAQSALASSLPVHAVAEDHTVKGVVRVVAELLARPNSRRQQTIDASTLSATGIRDAAMPPGEPLK